MSAEGDFILRTEGLSKSFLGFYAVKNVSLCVRRHDIHALIGPNGAGKTTCFNLLTAFIPASAGRIHYNGRDITRSDPAGVAIGGMVRSFQISAVFGQMSVLDNVRVALQRKAGGTYAFWRSHRVLDRHTARARERLAAVNLEPYAQHVAADLSYGRKRALELATTLALEPEMILLDEPMAGLGHEDIGPVTRLIAQVAKGRTVLMVEHNMKVVAELCDRITVLQAGEVLAEGSYDEVSNDPLVREAYVGGVHA
ncbi:Lipopolysaccharide export system ATP-binding protein LptB (plasmid) [Variovorax sp. SRS16]|uniref:ABC transporter ATP-binding protein n=1 Tax=Variovorax sp. SRS16 TaxID=282217 RepID=UPI0013196004|nr:ABC transporter ATP-binding protein [Variovorax sp. SRS16]VTU46365.1 Lipopolysaccharide export system ATP-binding protein LptB [Variovorax sp. SRS16]